MNDFFFGFEHSPLLWCALPVFLVLLLLYLFYRRSKTRIVSAIFLWDRPQATPNSGTRIKFRFPPPVFYLELAALLLLTAALAAPFVSTPETFPPLAVILDDSISMQAKVPGGKSPLESGAAFLKRELRALPDRRVLWIVAGESPVLASDSSARTDFSAFWTGQAGSSDLVAAASLARRMARGCQLLIVTDRKPAIELAPDTTCFSEGAPLGNSAIVNARRTAGRILIEAANFSALPLDAALVLEPGSLRTQIRLAPKETRRIVLAVPSAAAREAVTVRLENPDATSNALLCDDEVVLEAEDDSPVSYRIAAGFPAAARAALDRVLNGNPAFRPAATGEIPDLDILPAEAESPAPVHFYWLSAPAKRPAASANPPQGAPAGTAATTNPPPNEDDGPSASGPLSPEESSEISRGLPLDSLQWPVSAYDLPGQTLLRSGDVPVLSSRRNLDRDREIFLNLYPARSNIARHPFWPVFFQNLAQTVRAERFGPARTNLHSGELLHIRLPRGAQSLTAVRPDGKSMEIRAVRGQADFRPALHGEWRLESGDAKWFVSVTGLGAEESDLSGAGQFRRDADKLAVMPFWMLRPLAWAFLLLAALLLAAHHIVLTRKGGRQC